MFVHFKTFPVGSIHIWFDFMFTEPHDVPPTFCFDAQTDMKFLLQQFLLQRLLSEERSFCNENLMSAPTLQQMIGGTLRGFKNIKSNQNISRFDWKCFPEYEHRLNQSKWTFYTYIPKCEICIFPAVGEWNTWHVFPWASYQISKIVGCACAENAGNVFPATDFKGNS